MRSTSGVSTVLCGMLWLSLLGIGPVPKGAQRTTVDFPAKVHRSVAQRFEEAGLDTTPVWIFFTDKGPIDHADAVSELLRTTSLRTVERRRLRRTAPGLFDERDLPVFNGYVDAVTRRGAKLRTRSRWLNAISVEATAGQVASTARLPFVEKVQAVGRLDPPEIIDRTDEEECLEELSRSSLGFFYGASEAQLALINLIALHEEGFTGAGVVIGVLDTGFKRTHDAFTNPLAPIDVVAEYDFVDDDFNTSQEAGDAPDQHDHGTLVLGVMAANLPGLIVGGAYDASYILAKVESISYENTSEEDFFVAGLEFIEANGGDVATSSVVIFNTYTLAELDGLTTVMTIGLNTATENGLHVFQGAGNEGHDADPATSRLVPPADAFGVITVGAVDINGDLAWFSSDGPTADGRVKPEVLGMGLDTIMPDSFDDMAITSASGTSFATPLTAAAAACLVQKHPDWTVRQLRAALFQTASWYQITQTFDAQFVWGYGMIDVHAAGLLNPSNADLNEDFVVSVPDLVELLAAWGPCPGVGTCTADIDGNGQVGVMDLIEMLRDWG